MLETIQSQAVGKASKSTKALAYRLGCMGSLLRRCSLDLLRWRNIVRPLSALSFLGAFLFTQSAAAEARTDIAEELGCLALNIYFEARGEPDLGKIAVAYVVLNRVVDKRFPATICDVVRQGSEQQLRRCQFSWWCDGRSDKPRDAQSWRKVQAMARQVYWGFFPDPTAGALWYHADSVSPAWGQVFDRGPQIGQHIFYVDGKLLPQL